MKETEFKVIENSLFFKGRKLYNFSFPIKMFIPYKEDCLVLDKGLNKSNLFCIDQDGKLKWQVEEREKNPEFYPFINIKIKEDKIIAYDGNFETLINPNTGKILNIQFVK